MLLENCNT